MSIAIFLGALGSQAGGMETYELQFLHALARQDREESYVVYCLRRQARALLQIDQPNFRFTVLWPGFRPIDVGLTMPGLLAFSRVRLLHPTYIPPFFSVRPCVYTVHSAVTWSHPEFYPNWIRWRLNALQEKGIREARALLCVSGYVKDFITAEFRVPKERMEVIYHGVSSQFKPRRTETVLPMLKTRHGIDYPYFLFAGKLTANKNISRLLHAFSQFRRERRSDLRLVLAGRRLWSRGELDAELNQATATGHVVELGHVEPADMPLLYNGARGLVFPSLHEGFGLPVLEAFASGTPALTSNNSSLPEIAGGQALLVNELSVEEIADGMGRLAEDETMREKLIQGGLARVKQFTWEKTAERTRRVYARVLAECPR